jgi:hypothetical protein
VKSYFEMDKWSKEGWEKFNDLRKEVDRISGYLHHEKV